MKTKIKILATAFCLIVLLGSCSKVHEFPKNPKSPRKYSGKWIVGYTKWKDSLIFRDNNLDTIKKIQIPNQIKEEFSLSDFQEGVDSVAYEKTLFNEKIKKDNFWKFPIIKSQYVIKGYSFDYDKLEFKQFKINYIYDHKIMSLKWSIVIFVVSIFIALFIYVNLDDSERIFWFLVIFIAISVVLSLLFSTGVGFWNLFIPLIIPQLVILVIIILLVFLMKKIL